MKTNVVRRKMIKPSIPTPQSLKNYKISCIDELAPSTNIGILLFYPSKPENIIQKLEESLRKILPQFYVLAGRYIKGAHCIDCSDQGAEFVEAEAGDDQLVDIVGTTDQLNDLLPRRSYQMDGASDPLLSVQITDLNRGGLVIGVSVSHRIFDTCSLATFISTWSNAHSSSGEKITIVPSFDESTALFPGRNRDNPNGECSRMEDPGIVCKMLCFNREAIDSLRSKLRPKDGKLRCSKVLVVSAVIAKALIVLDREKHGRSRDCFVNHAVNMRVRTVPPLRRHACGNLVLQALSSCIAAAETAEIGIQELADLMGDAIAKSISKCGAIGANKLTLKPVVKGSREAFAAWFSDWSKFGFCEADFGWGKPVWAGIAPMHAENTTLLMGNRDGDGIEAWVHLHKDDMKLFEQHEEIRLFSA